MRVVLSIWIVVAFGWGALEATVVVTSGGGSLGVFESLVFPVHDDPFGRRDVFGTLPDAARRQWASEMYEDLMNGALPTPKEMAQNLVRFVRSALTIHVHIRLIGVQNTSETLLESLINVLDHSRAASERVFPIKYSVSHAPNRLSEIIRDAGADLVQAGRHLIRDFQHSPSFVVNSYTMFVVSCKIFKNATGPIPGGCDPGQLHHHVDTIHLASARFAFIYAEGIRDMQEATYTAPSLLARAASASERVFAPEPLPDSRPFARKIRLEVIPHTSRLTKEEMATVVGSVEQFLNAIALPNQEFDLVVTNSTKRCIRCDIAAAKALQKGTSGPWLDPLEMERYLSGDSSHSTEDKAHPIEMLLPINLFILDQEDIYPHQRSHKGNHALFRGYPRTAMVLYSKDSERLRSDILASILQSVYGIREPAVFHEIHNKAYTQEPIHQELSPIPFGINNLEERSCPQSLADLALHHSVHYILDHHLQRVVDRFRILDSLGIQPRDVLSKSHDEYFRQRYLLFLLRLRLLESEMQSGDQAGALYFASSSYQDSAIIDASLYMELLQDIDHLLELPAALDGLKRLSALLSCFSVAVGLSSGATYGMLTWRLKSKKE